MIGRHQLAGAALSLVLGLAGDGLLFAVLSRRAGLAVLDVRDPLAPAVVKWFEDLDVVGVALIDGLIAALVSEERQLPGEPASIAVQSVRMLDPSPETGSAEIDRGELDKTTPPAEGLLSVGHRAFVCAQSHVLELDVSEPSAPVLAGTFRVPPSSNMGSASPRSDTASPGRLAATDDRLCVTYNRYDTSGSEPNDSGVVIFDISVSGDARETGAWSQGAPGNVNALAVVGDLLLVGEIPAYRLRLYGITDQASPRQVSTIEVDTAVRDFAASGDRLVVLDPSYALHVIDLSDPVRPVLLARRELWRATAVEIRGDTTCAAFYGPGETGDDVGELAVLRITPGSELEELFRWEGLPRTATDLAWSGQALVMTSQLEGLTFMDVSDPIRPTLLGRVGTPYRAMGTAWSNRSAYVAVMLPTPEEDRQSRPLPRHGGVMVVDASDPASPATLGIGGVHLDDYRGNVARWGIGVVTGYALLAAAEGCVRVFDVRDPAAMDQVQQLLLPGVQGALATSGNYAYVAGADAGLSVLRVDDAGPNEGTAIYLPLGIRPR